MCVNGFIRPCFVVRADVTYVAKVEDKIMNVSLL